MSARNPGMDKATYATKAGFAPKKPEKMQMGQKMDMTTPGTKSGAAKNPKPASSVVYGAKPGLHTAGSHGMSAPKGKPYPAVD